MKLRPLHETRASEIQAQMPPDRLRVHRIGADQLDLVLGIREAQVLRDGTDVALPSSARVPVAIEDPDPHQRSRFLSMRGPRRARLSWIRARTLSSMKSCARFSARVP